MTAIRNAEQTRKKILETTAELINVQGFKGLRVDDVVKETGLTKGALYHHFSNKSSLGYAVVDELLKCQYEEFWINPLKACENPIDCLVNSFNEASNMMTMEMLSAGCPVCNLGQEMSATDEGFRQRIGDIFETWSETMIIALKEGQEKNLVRRDIDAQASANFIVASSNGIMSAAKCTKSLELFKSTTGVLCTFIESLRA